PLRRVDFRVGVVGGMATGELNAEELRAEVKQSAEHVNEITLSDGGSELDIIANGTADELGRQVLGRVYTIGGGQLRVRTVTEVNSTTIFDQMATLLPLLVWGVAALLSWYLVKRLLILPLGRLKKAVLTYQPGDDRLELPEKLGPAAEIHELGQAFERAVERIEESEKQMADALSGQRRLVREVHHRVKNNLQVVASLLNIHGRSATT